MTLIIDRRMLLATATLGIGAMAMPGFAQSFAGTGFTHAVASGEPASDAVLLWTRYVPAGGGPVELRVEVAENADFTKVVAGGAAITGPWRDHTAKITVDGLQPGRAYLYRFVAPDGTTSPVGRTKTLPDGEAHRFRAAIFSCSNMPFGYFNAYAHAAASGDFDCAIHLGDYFYEYPTGDYPPAGQAVAGRQPQPATELLHLADYRLRYASYRADPDLQRLHLAMPMIAQWDDHESANDSWEGGAQNHQSDEGPWDARKAAAIQAYREWMPVSDEPWKAYEIGDLATLFRTETRLLARTAQPDVAPLFRDADPAAALVRFRDTRWQDPAMTMMGSQQEYWLDHAMRASVGAGKRWQVVGFGTIMGATDMPVAAAGLLSPDAPARARAYFGDGLAAAKVGLPFNYDNWGGYPAARARFLRSARAMGADLVVISGDSHNAWAYDLAQDGHAAGVEFAGTSITSPGFEGAIGVGRAGEAARAFVAANPELKWCDLSQRGYMALTITRDAVMNDWLMVETIRSRNAAAKVAHRATVERGRRTMT